MNEEELVYQLKQESQDAFNRIYNMYSARLYAYCMQYVKSREDTEEIVQDVFMVGSINSIFYFLHKAAEPFNCLEQDNLAQS